MKTLTFYFCFALLPTFFISAQVGIGNTNPNATLDISASNQATPANTDGILIPKIDEYPAVNPTAAQDGMLVYVTGNGSIAKGFYYWDSFAISWIAFSGSTIEKIDDLIDGKSDSDGTDDGSSIFLGINSGAIDDGSDNRNIAVGYESLMANTSGFDNIAIGYRSLFNNIDGFGNEAIGYNSLLNNIDGDGNVAIGRNTLHNNSSGSYNAAIGYRALFRNTTGENNTAIGRFAIHDNRQGSLNTGIGNNAMSNMSSGDENVSFGANSLHNNTTGSQNTSIGTESLYDNTGNGNVAIGFQSGLTNTGSNNIFIGNNAGVNSFAVNNKLYIENLGSTIPLVYGEFDNDLLQVNGTFQINNPTTTGYQFPAADGLAGNVLQTDGNGNLSFVDAPDADTEWSKTGNSGTDSITNFIGTTDTQDLSFRTNNINKMRLTQKGQLEFFDTGGSVFIGEGAGANDDLTGNLNTYVGYMSGSSNTSGSQNSFFGFESGLFNSTGSSNSFFGSNSGVGNTLGTGNSFFGNSSGRNNTLGNGNSFFGVSSGENNTNGFGNSFFGVSSGTQNVTGVFNNFFGTESGFSNSTGEENNFFGFQSGFSNTVGEENSFFGNLSGFNNTDGVSNSFFGNDSGSNNTIGSFNVAIGNSALQNNEIGNRNVAIGNQAGSGTIGNSKNDGIFIGNRAGYFENSSNRLYIENSSSTDPLIYGEFDIDLLRANGDFEVVKATNSTLKVKTSDGNSSSISLLEGADFGFELLYTGSDDKLNLWSRNFSGNEAERMTWLKDGRIGINDNAPNAALDIEASNVASPRSVDGILIPRIDAFPTTNPTIAQNGMLVYLNADSSFYHWHHATTSWISLGSIEQINDLTDGKSDSDGTDNGSSIYLGVNAGSNDDASDNRNIGIGLNALTSNTSGNTNTGVGYLSLFSNTTGASNTAIGFVSLSGNTTGDGNIAIGHYSLFLNTTGIRNTAIGSNSLDSNIVGNNNTALGSNSGPTISTLSNTTAVGYNAVPSIPNSVRVGNSSITSIGGHANWTVFSDRRIKTNVQEQIVGLDFIKKLRPVSYNLDMDTIARFEKTPDSLRLKDAEMLKAKETQTGFIAQEVEVAAKDAGFNFHGIVTPSENGGLYALRYAEFVVPLVKAMQEQQEEIDKLKTLLQLQQMELNEIKETLKTLTAKN